MEFMVCDLIRSELYGKLLAESGNRHCKSNICLHTPCFNYDESKTKLSARFYHNVHYCWWLIILSCSITEIITTSPTGLRKSALAVATDNSRQWYVNVTWFIAASQEGPNLFCYSAIDSTE